MNSSKCPPLKSGRSWPAKSAQSTKKPKRPALARPTLPNVAPSSLSHSGSGLSEGVTVTTLPASPAHIVELIEGKLLLGLARGGAVETVMMPSYRAGEAWCCVSSQVGCAMGCDFCASTRGGLERNLEVDEIVEQYLRVGALAAAQGRRVRRLVFMGMGEPLHNLDAVLPAIDRIAGPGLGNLGWRRITVSTVGIVQGIAKLAAAAHPVFLALSLHAPDDATRSRIVPAGKRYGVAEILTAARDYQATTDRIVTIEYCLLAGVNDSDAQAELLAERLADFRAHVNVIPYNATGPGLSGITYVRPSPARVERFLAILRGRGVVAHARDTRGDDVAAACGQLREGSRAS